MTSSPDDRGETPGGSEPGDPARYPTDHLVAVLDTPEQTRAAVEALTARGFADSTIRVGTGEAAADHLGATTGRVGLANVAINIADWFGVKNDEMRVKDRYEAAMRDGRFVLRVGAADDVRRDEAARILAGEGAHDMTFLGRFTIETITPPNEL